MLKTQTGLITPTELENLIQTRLTLEPAAIVPQRVNCVVKEHNLLVFLHYQQPKMPYPRRVFGLLQEIAQEVQLSGEYQILMYIVVEGQYQTNLTLPEANQPQQPKPLSLNAGVEAKSSPHRRTISSKGKVAIAVGGLIALILGVYEANRRCVFSTCALIPQANQLAEKAALIVEYTPENLDKAQSQLQQSQKLLQSIPAWSPHYREAQILHQNYQAEADDLDKLTQATAMSEQAISLTLPPLSPEECQEIESLWQQAFDLLQEIPPTSAVYKLAQDHLPEIREAKTAITSLKTAQSAAELGKVRETVARSLANWQLVAATWRTAMERLDGIPPTSFLVQTSQVKQLKALYNSRLEQANQRIETEKLANQILERGKQQATMAANQTKSKQWQGATASWRQALATLAEIPDHTHAATTASNLAASYQKSLEDTQAKLKIVANLEQVCNSYIRFCDFNIGSEQITVQLTPAYQQQVWQMSSQNLGYQNAAIQTQLANHLNGLKTVLQSISDDTGLPLELYNAQKVLMASYLPSS